MVIKAHRIWGRFKICPFNIFMLYVSQNQRNVRVLETLNNKVKNYSMDSPPFIENPFK